MPVPIIEPPVAVQRQAARPRMTARQVRDLIGLALIVLGAAGLVAAACLWSPLAGFAAGSLALVLVGLALSYDW